MQHKTQRPVQFEITIITREALQKWIKVADLKSDCFLFPSRLHDSPHLGIISASTTSCEVMLSYIDQPTMRPE